MTRNATLRLICLSVLLALVSGIAAQPQQSEGIDELIVLVRAGEGMPTAQSVAEMINDGLDPGNGLGEGAPVRATLAIPELVAGQGLATGRLLEFIRNHPDSALARLGRYLVLQYGPGVDLDAMIVDLAGSPAVEFVEKNKRMTLSAVPNDPWLGSPGADPLMSQWGVFAMKFPEAWNYSTGNCMVGVIDTGIEPLHFDLADNFLEHFSTDFVTDDCNVDEMEGRVCIDDFDPHVGTRVGHGSFVLGTIAASANNGLGVAGTCWSCSAAMMRTFVQPTNEAAFSDVGIAMSRLIRWGFQVINLSGGIPGESCQDGSFFLSILCSSMTLADESGVIFVAAAGNGNTSVEFPANDPRVIAVGAVQLDSPATQSYSRWIQSPFGSNFGPELDLVAPGKTVLSTAYTGKTWNQGLSCGDGKYFEPDDGDEENGIGPCTGTSLATPHVTGAASLVLSANPLLSNREVKDVLTSTASQAQSRDDFLGRGLPDVESAVIKALGKSGGDVLPNRVVPLFSFFSQFDNSHMYTTFLATASAFILDSFDSVGEPVPGLERFPGPVCTTPPCPLDENPPAASMYVLTTRVEPGADSPVIVPLYRMRKDPNIPNRCVPGSPRLAGRKFALATTQAEVDLFRAKGFVLDGIDGFIYANCTQAGCAPAGTERVHRLFNSAVQDYGLFLESDLPVPGYAPPTDLPEVVGLAYAPVDSDRDNVIDGFEVLAGTSAGAADSDCDGVNDGDEILVYDMTDPNPLNHGFSDPLDGPCNAIFTSGFELGNTSRWSNTINQ